MKTIRVVIYCGAILLVRMSVGATEDQVSRIYNSDNLKEGEFNKDLVLVPAMALIATPDSYNGEKIAASGWITFPESPKGNKFALLYPSLSLAKVGDPATAIFLWRAKIIDALKELGYKEFSAQSVYFCVLSGGFDGFTHLAANSGALLYRLNFVGPYEVFQVVPASKIQEEIPLKWADRISSPLTEQEIKRQNQIDKLYGFPSVEEKQQADKAAESAE